MNLDEAIKQLEQIITEVRQASLTDDKTTLGNALALDQEARLMSEGVSEFDVVVFGDLNDFKRLNDDYTHAAGNVAIKKVGETVHKIVIEGLQAKAFRPSGDEFVILLKQDLVERFLSAASFLGNILFSYNEKELKTAMSLGYAISDGKASFSELQERAEIACQSAKRQGDGVCIIWSEDVQQNTLVRLRGGCQNCRATIYCDVPKQNLPLKLKQCPCCGAPLTRLAEKETRKAKRQRKK